MNYYNPLSAIIGYVLVAIILFGIFESYLNNWNFPGGALLLLVLLFIVSYKNGIFKEPQ